MATAAEDRNFKSFAKTQAEEDAYDYTKDRTGITTSFAGSVAHLIKGALGGGILTGPVAYKKAGVLVAMPLNILFGVFMCYSLYLLVRCKKILLRRMRRTHLSYADCGEACLMIFPKPNYAKYAQCFRYFIDATICVDLFGACCSYQIVVAKSLKQLVENTQESKMEGIGPGYPSLRIYLLIMLPFFCLICLIRHLKYLAPFSHAANGVVASSIILTIYYCFQNNPSFKGLTLATDFDGIFQFIGMSVFSMSCSGVVIPIEGNMQDPKKFTPCLLMGHTFIIFCTTATSFFGYSAFLEKAEAPFTINFPMTTVPKIFKAAICVMLYVTHGLNFWVPFNLCWYYMKKRVNQDKVVFWERVYRVLFVLIIGIIGVIFPSITALMGLLGCLCLANMAIVFPNIITLFVEYERPGYGALKWRVWRAVFFIIIGIFVTISGTIINAKELFKVLTGSGGG